MNKIHLLLSGLISCTLVNAQFAPQAGTPGTTAIHKDSSVFQAWATHCTVKPGWQNIADTTLGKAQVGDATYVPGTAGNGVVSLGDGGEAIVQFEHPIVNGEGYDFAIFENGFIDQTLAPGTAFLELAFVEVSSDGIHFTRFPATSLNDTASQLGSFEGMVATKINNLAGKYLGNYGTPFDLDEIKDSPDLNIQYITHVKIIDVVGSVQQQYASRDAGGNIVNDPWPTAFASSGFDLDAVGVIHHDITQGIKTVNGTAKIQLYPNPAQTFQMISIHQADPVAVLTVFDMLGNEIHSYSVNQTGANRILSFEQAGCYQLILQTENGILQQRLIVH
jgi:hypothetical protein